MARAGHRPDVPSLDPRPVTQMMGRSPPSATWLPPGRRGSRRGDGATNRLRQSPGLRRTDAAVRAFSASRRDDAPALYSFTAWTTSVESSSESVGLTEGIVGSSPLTAIWTITM